MPGLLTMTHSTYVALLTVEYSFQNRFIVIEGTSFTIVKRKFFFALDACLSFWLLFVAAQAFYHCNLEPIELVVKFRVLHILVHFFIVADSTGIVLSIANWVRTLQLAFPQIMFATHLTFFQLYFPTGDVCSWFFWLAITFSTLITLWLHLCLFLISINLNCFGAISGWILWSLFWTIFLSRVHFMKVVLWKFKFFW